MVGRRGTTILSTPPLNSARTRAMSASYPKLIRRSKWPAPRGEEMNGSATTCSTRRLRVESVISSRWYPERNVVRMYAVGVVWTVMCGPCGPVAIVVALHGWDEGGGLRIVVVLMVGWG
jgi:hypothetical protein